MQNNDLLQKTGFWAVPLWLISTFPEFLGDQEIFILIIMYNIYNILYYLAYLVDGLYGSNVK